MRFYDYDDVPKNIRQIIREQKNITRITELSIEEINSLAEECIDILNAREKLKTFHVAYSYPGQKPSVLKFEDLEEAYVCMDRLTNYERGSDVTIIFAQAGNVVRRYKDREWIYD